MRAGGWPDPNSDCANARAPTARADARGTNHIHIVHTQSLTRRVVGETHREGWTWWQKTKAAKELTPALAMQMWVEGSLDKLKSSPSLIGAWNKRCPSVPRPPRDRLQARRARFGVALFATVVLASQRGAAPSPPAARCSV